MTIELESLIETVELVRLRLSNIKSTLDADSSDLAKQDAIDDAELALAWALKKLQHLNDPPHAARTH